MSEMTGRRRRAGMRRREEVADGERGCGRRVEEGDQSPISRGSVTRGGAGLCLPQVFFCGGPAGRPLK